MVRGGGGGGAGGVVRDGNPSSYSRLYMAEDIINLGKTKVAKSIHLGIDTLYFIMFNRIRPMKDTSVSGPGNRFAAYFCLSNGTTDGNDSL